MSKRFFLTRSRHDMANHYLYAYSNEVLDCAVTKGWRVEKAEDEDNNRRNVQSRLSKGHDLITFNGHGNERSVFGHANEELVGESEAGLLKDAVVFIRSCSSLAGLGRTAVAKGARAVVGYRGEFWFPRVHEYEARPLQDPSAKPVLDASNAIPLRLLHGASVQEAVESSKSKSDEHILKMLSSSEPYDAAALRALVNNAVLLGYEGQPNARA